MSSVPELTDDERDEYRRNPSLLNSPSFTPSLLRPTPSPVRNADRASSQTESASPAPKLGTMKRDKYSSEATIFLKNTIRAPDVKEIVKCLSTALHRVLVEHSSLPVLEEEIFSEKLHPLGDAFSDNPDNFKMLPAFNVVHNFIAFVFGEQDLSAECAVMAFAYVDRLVTLTNLTLTPWNWRRVLLGALILAAKVWEDLAVWNADFLSAFPRLDVKDLNRLERAYLVSLQFVVTLKSSVYAKYYFELRGLSLAGEDFPMQPLSKEDANRLERLSHGMEETSRRFGIQKSSSDSEVQGGVGGGSGLADFVSIRRDLKKSSGDF